MFGSCEYVKLMIRGRFTDTLTFKKARVERQDEHAIVVDGLKYDPRNGCLLDVNEGNLFYQIQPWTEQDEIQMEEEFREHIFKDLLGLMMDKKLSPSETDLLKLQDLVVSMSRCPAESVNA